MREIARGRLRKKNPTRIVLALPGAHSLPFEYGTVAEVARRAAGVARGLSIRPEIDVYLYTEEPHALPPLPVSGVDEWVREWAEIERTPLLPSDARPKNSLSRRAEEFGLFGTESAARAVRVISYTAVAEDGPTLVLFYSWRLLDDDRKIAAELDRAAEEDVFWQFFGEFDAGSSLLTRLGELQVEAPHIQNIDFYQGGWQSLEDVPRVLFRRGVTRPFKRWLVTRDDEGLGGRHRGEPRPVGDQSDP